MSSKKFLSDLSIETRKIWKRMEELILLHLDENDEDSILDIYQNTNYMNNDIRSILLSSVGVKDKRKSIFKYELINFINNLKQKYNGKDLINYLNCCDEDGYNLLDTCMNGYFGRKTHITFFISGDWKIDKDIRDILIKIGLKKRKTNSIKSRSRKKNSYLRRSKINRI